MPFRVGLCMPTNAGIYRGIAQYLKTHERWRVDYVDQWGDSRLRTAEVLREFQAWEGDGILTMPFDAGTAEILFHRGLPTVSFTDAFADQIFTIHSDNWAIGRMGAEYLLERNLQTLAYYGRMDAAYARQRWEGFQTRTRQEGIEPFLYDTAASGASSTRLGMSFLSWLRDLPRPMGILAECDMSGRDVVHACIEGGIHVPMEVAVLGVDNVPHVCEFEQMPLSSIEPNFERIGYLAAGVLEGMMIGRASRRGLLLVPPRGVVTRRSTDVMALQDSLVADACWYMQQHLTEPLTAEDVAAAVSSSRRNLDRRFRLALGRSPADHLVTLRLNRAKELLRDTSESMSEIARLSGFTDTNHLGRTFRRVTGASPTAYRRETQMH